MKTVKKALLILYLTLWLPLSAQVNLVPNPGFENYINCPSYLANMPMYPDSLLTVKNWFSPTLTSPDYFNACSNPNINCGVPQNELSGYSPPHGGSAYTGILAFYGPRKNYREFVSTTLTQPLKQDKIYVVSYYVWLGKGQTAIDGLAATSTLGCALTNHMNFNDSTLLLQKPQVQNADTSFLNDTTQWMEVYGLYKAKGGELYITLGNFLSDSLTPQESLIAPANICYYLIDDVSVMVFDTSNFRSDTTLCEGDSVTLTKRPKASGCMWNDGSNHHTRTFKEDGIYWVTNYFNSEIGITDTFVVHIITSTSSTSDTIVCNATSMKLTAQKASTYLWNTNLKTQSITITKSGTYWVTRTIPGCAITDSFTASIFPGPTIPFVNDTAVCFDQVTQILLDAGAFKNYLWKPTEDTSRYIYSTKAQPYLLTVTDSDDCTASKQFDVLESCPDFMFVPNAFTPNGDGLNDVFLPQTRSIETYEMTILNRWGQVVFTTHNTEQGWDGNNAPPDVYVVHIIYQPQGKSSQSLSQNITLLR